MKMATKLLALLTVLAMVLAACGGGGEEEEGGDTTAAAVEETAAAADETTDGAAETTASSGGDDATAEIATDVGVDLEAGTITVGMLSDLTGAFGPLVTVIVAGAEAYWEDVNANGGVNGLTVDLEVRDTGYDIPTHVQLYEELRGQVVAFGHSTGTPQTVAINEQLQSDGILAIPLTWYSGWTDPTINSNLIHHGIPYCLESMNLLEYITTEQGGTSVAIASVPGDYGLDSAAGAKIAIEELGLEMVYDGSGALNPSDESTFTAVANGIAESGADIVFMTATPGVWSSVYGQVLQSGMEATWTGAGPSWNQAFIAEESPIRDAVARDFVGNLYFDVWNGDSEGAQRAAEIMGDAEPNDNYNEGMVEAMILHQALLKAYENGDMTQQGVLDAAKSLETVTFDGLAPDETFTGEPNEQVQRTGNIFVPSLDATTGTEVVAADYTSETAANYEFTEACYTLE